MTTDLRPRDAGRLTRLPSSHVFREAEAKVRNMREQINKLEVDYEKTEEDLRALQSVGQIIGEVLRQLDEERFIVKSSSGPRYVVGCRSQVDKEKLTANTRVGPGCDHPHDHAHPAA